MGACLALGACAAPAPRPTVAPPRRAWTLRVLGYHRFGPEKAGDDFQISPRRLAGELSWLRSSGYQPVSLTQVAEALAGRDAGFPARAVLVSIDDGYASGWKVAAPVLKKYGFRAVYFVVVGRIGRAGMLGWKDLKEIEDQGFEVGCHSWWHSDLARPLRGESLESYRERLWREIFLSRRALEKGLGRPVDWFAYPYGALNPFVESAVSQAGYRLAFSATTGVVDPGRGPLRLKRVMVEGHPSLAVFKRLVGDRPMRVELEGLEDNGTVAWSGPLKVRLKLLDPDRVSWLRAGLDDQPLALRRQKDGWWSGVIRPPHPARVFRFFKLFARRGREGFEQQWLFERALKRWKPYFAALDWKRWEAGRARAAEAP